MLIRVLIGMASFFILISGSHASEITGSLNRPVLNLYDEELFCSGKFDKVQEKLRKYDQSSPYWLEAQMHLQYFPESRVKINDDTGQYIKLMKSMTDEQRILLATAWINSARSPLSFVKDILNFETSDKKIEIFRRQLLVTSNLELHIFDYIKNYQETFRDLPYLDIQVLTGLYLTGLNLGDYGRVLSQYQPFIEKFQMNSSRLFLQVLEFQMGNDRIISNESRTILKFAYEKCPYDFTLSMYYGLLLGQDKKFSEAEAVFQKRLSHPVMSPYDFYYLGVMQYAQHRYIDALRNWSIAKDHSDYLKKSELEDLNNRINGFWLMLGLIASAILVLLIGIIFIVRSRKRDRSVHSP